MAKAHGRSARVYANGYDLSGSTGEFEADDSTAFADATTFLDTSKRYLLGLSEGKASQKAFFDDSAGAIWPMIVAVRDATSAVAVFYPAGDGAQGNVGLGSAIAELLADAKLTSPVAGAVALNASWVASGGWETLLSLLPTGQQTGTASAVNTAALDNAASSAAGASAFFWITAVDAATTVTLKVQHSSDNSSWTDLLTSGLDGSAAGQDRQATATGATINRYVRAQYTITSGKHATVGVAFSRK